MLMEYTELIDKIEGLKEVTEAMVDEAHAACASWNGDEEKKEERGRGDKERERERERDKEKEKERERERDRDRHEQLKGADGTPIHHGRILDTNRDRTPSTASNASTNSASKASNEETKEDVQQRLTSTTAANTPLNDAAADTMVVRPAGRARPGRGERDSKVGGGGMGVGGFGERAGAGKGAGHSIFDKLSIRTNGSKPSASQATGRRGTEQLSANILSPRSGGASANSANSAGGSAVSPSTGVGVSSRHRKSISLANIAHSGSASAVDPPSRPSAHLAVANTHSEQKASTQPLRFPPISPTATSHQPHSAAPTLSSDDTPNPISPPVGRTAKGRHKLPTSSLLDDHSSNASSSPLKPSIAAATTKRSKPLPPPVEVPIVRRPSIDATSGSGSAAGMAAGVGGVVGASGGGYMADTNASRHRLLNKLNVDLSA